MEHRAKRAHRTKKDQREEASGALAQLHKRSWDHLAQIERIDARLNDFVNQMLAQQGRALEALRAENGQLRSQASDPAAEAGTE